MSERENDQARRIDAMVNTIAREALAFAPDERLAVIRKATRDLRDHFLSKFSQGPKREEAEAFISDLEDRGMQALKFLEASEETTGRA